eukprot:363066-Chlamydomonas_euryale.AAC.11
MLAGAGLAGWRARQVSLPTPANVLRQVQQCKLTCCAFGRFLPICNMGFVHVMPPAYEPAERGLLCVRFSSVDTPVNLPLWLAPGALGIGGRDNIEKGGALYCDVAVLRRIIRCQ